MTAYTAILVCDADEADVTFRGEPAGSSTTSWDDLVQFAADVSDRLGAGTARLSEIEMGTASVPTGIIVGGWAVPDPCCESFAVRGTKTLFWPGTAEDHATCAGCGSIVPADTWAMVPLGPAATSVGGWHLPTAERLAEVADATLRAIVADRNAEARRQTEYALETMSAPVVQRPAARPTLGDHPTMRSGVGLWTTIAAISGEADDDGRGTARFEHRKVEPADGAHGPLVASWEVVGELQISAADAVRLLNPVERRDVEEQARSGVLSGERLRAAWSHAGPLVPPWLVAAEAVESINTQHSASRGSRESAGVEL